MKNNKIYYSPRCISSACDPRKALMISSLTGGENGSLSDENGSWGSNSGESMGTEDGNW